MFLSTYQWYQYHAAAQSSCYSFLEWKNKFSFPTDYHQNFSKFLSYFSYQYKNSQTFWKDSSIIKQCFHFLLLEFLYIAKWELRRRVVKDILHFLKNQAILHIKKTKQNPAQSDSSFTIHCFISKSLLGFSQPCNNSRYFLRVPFMVVFIWRLSSLDFNEFLQSIMLFQKNQKNFGLSSFREKNVNTAHMKNKTVTIKIYPIKLKMKPWIIA